MGKYLNKTETVAIIETGEIKQGTFIPAEVSNDFNITHKSVAEAFKKKNEAISDVNYFGSLNGTKYTFNVERSVIDLFNNDNFTDSEKVHIMYLGSFVNYDGFLMGKNNHPLQKADVMKMVTIKNRKRFYDFYNKLVQYGFIKEGSSVTPRLYWNTKLSFKGSTTINGTKSNKVIRMYDETIQRLYEENPAKSLVIIFRLLPYLNKFHNVLCKDTEATDYINSNPLTVEEVGEAIGEGDKKYLQRRLLKLRVGDEYIFSLRKTGDVTNVILNPSLVWLSSYAPPSNLVGDFSLAKKQLLEDKEKKAEAIKQAKHRTSFVKK